jgi:hypothetical protein
MNSIQVKQKQETAKLIGINTIGISGTLTSLYYLNRRTESLIETCALLLRAYHDTDSDYMRNTYRKLMERIYFEL